MQVPGNGDELQLLATRLTELDDEVASVTARTHVLEQQRRGDLTRVDELVGAIRETGERLRGTHGVATDTAVAINGVREDVREVRKLVEAMALTLELLVEDRRRVPPKRKGQR